MTSSAGGKREFWVFGGLADCVSGGEGAGVAAEDCCCGGGVANTGVDDEVAALYVGLIDCCKVEI